VQIPTLNGTKPFIGQTRMVRGAKIWVEMGRGISINEMGEDADLVPRLSESCIF
jgi:hypothetical protein